MDWHPDNLVPGKKYLWEYMSANALIQKDKGWFVGMDLGMGTLWLIFRHKGVPPDNDYTAPIEVQAIINIKEITS